MQSHGSLWGWEPGERDLRSSALLLEESLWPGEWLVPGPEQRQQTLWKAVAGAQGPEDNGWDLADGNELSRDRK